jgi:hypothetical protein
MTSTRRTKRIDESGYVAEVDVDLIYDGTGWEPYLALEDGLRLDAVRLALRRGDVVEAARQSRVFALVPVSV